MSSKWISNFGDFSEDICKRLEEASNDSRLSLLDKAVLYHLYARFVNPRSLIIPIDIDFTEVADIVEAEEAVTIFSFVRLIQFGYIYMAEYGFSLFMEHASREEAKKRRNRLDGDLF